MRIKVHTMNSFAVEKDGGNPAAVVFIEDHLSEEAMQSAARKIGFSETAFVLKSEKADFKVRFFTPLAEVNLCGHATIGIFSLMKHLGRISSGTYMLETRGSILEVQVQGDEILLEMEPPRFYEKVSSEEVLDALNAASDVLIKEYSPQIVSTGLKDLIVPIRSRSALDGILPDMDKVVRLSETYDMDGLHLFALDNEVTAYTRNFAPMLGIPEESATGTASGALAAYLIHHGQEESRKDEMIFRQGYAMGRPSEIRVRVNMKDAALEKILVGGSAMDFRSFILEI